MKRIPAILAASALFVLAASFRTGEPVGTRENFRFAKKVQFDARPGSQFRYEMAVHADNGEALKKFRFYGISLDANGRQVGGRFGKLEQRREQEWIVYTVVGTIPANSNQVSFVAEVSGPGTFYFDDVNLFIEQHRGAWKQLDVSNPSFEESRGNGFADYAVMPDKSFTGRSELSSEIFKTGRQSLKVSFSEPGRNLHLAAGE